MNGFKLDQAITNERTSSDKDWLNNLLQKEITIGNAFGNKKKEDFYAELAVLLKAGIQLKDAIALIQGNQKKEKQMMLFSEMGNALVAGQSFFEVLKNKPEFSEYEYYSIKIGEETGTLPRIVEELGKFYERKNEQRRSLMNALTYPIIILCTAILVVVFMLRMVVPMFEDIFKQNGVELPGITKMIISASNFIRDYGWLVLLCVALLIVLRKVFSKKEWFKTANDRFIQKIPYIGNFVTSVYLAQFTQAVALLTASKVPMLNSIQLVKKMIDYHPLNEALENIEKDVTAGKSLNASMAGNAIFDNKMISLVKVAEETNQTEYIFERLSQQYAIEVQQKSKLLSTLMEPVIIIVIGVFVGVILVSMYLPMFKLSSVVG
ncbi:type IV pilus assembly protein PilC [Maribacter dokdonensis]|uniref:type II secretion system F family protein n=1 Tax=Maribacter dokdonensis TaxID=320912 RepID=UPI001B249F98|nr:type II secretion system F family protein [Maribacter dokdonensis]CAG2532847.1 type IV pilus assembly protein PilC [Maribacter dokdonensis]|tara:strand:+ start:1940 stop:3073 length:1134 start_codon:yes stop_codon:yes gene_type:complete